MLVRIGSRGSRLALTQAELAGDGAAAAGHEIAFVPITTAGDRDRSSPFGQIGERGVFVKEIEEALLAGRIDVAVHSAKDMTSTDTDGLAVGAYLERDDPRDALVGADEIRPGHADRHRVRPPQGAAARPRADALGRAAARQRRHPAAQGARARARRARARGVRPRPARPRRRDRPAACRSRRCCPEAAQGALALQVRAGEEELVAHARPRRDAAAGRGRAGVRRAVGAGCLAPVAAHHDGEQLTALIAAEDGSWIERRSGDRPGGGRRGARSRRRARACAA